jgi:NAD(P)-dependent dehydrogenase (short-subunit alcohol dehydrogenase family)
MNDFQGKVAVVTGGASGLGFAMAKRFAGEGMKVVLADVEPAALAQARDALTATGATVLAERIDVSVAADVQRLADLTQAAFGAIHVVCNNAGVGGLRRRAWEADLKDWAWVLGVNVWGVIHGVHAFVPRMLAQDCECHMVNTASVAGLLSTSSMSVYNVSKHAVVTLTETLYQDLALAKAKLKVSLLLPAWVDTQIWNSARNRPEELRVPEMEAGDETRREAMRELLRKGKVSADDVAGLVLDAIRNEHFYVMTHPRIRSVIETRMQDILQDRNPTFTN